MLYQVLAAELPIAANVKGDVEFVFGVGGDKTYSSSLVNNVERAWGDYKVIHEEQTAKVKILNIDIGKSISYQRHFYRGEIWHLVNGQAMIKTSKGTPNNYTYEYLTSGQNFSIIPYEWHQVTNMGKEPLRIIEIQHGSYVEEDDWSKDFNYHLNYDINPIYIFGYLDISFEQASKFIVSAGTTNIT